MTRVESYVLLSGALFAAMLLALEAGRRLGLRRPAVHAEEARTGNGVVEGAVFALLGLLVAFTFSGAAGRFEARRHLILEEANAIGTAYLRLDLLASQEQPALREKFRAYLESRIAVHRKLPDAAAALEELERATRLQGEIWKLALVALERDQRTPPTMLLLPALNNMFDIATSRLVAVRTHVQGAILILLFALSVLGALLAGHAMAARSGRHWLHMLAFAAVLALSIFVILDLEHPRAGLINIDAADRVLIDLLASMR